MRFCPFCSAENADELAVCQACGRRLPPLPPRRARNAPPTGVQLPPRAPGAPPPTPPSRTKPTTIPPAHPYASNAAEPSQAAPLPPPPAPASGRHAVPASGPVASSGGVPSSASTSTAIRSAPAQLPPQPPPARTPPQPSPNPYAQPDYLAQQRPQQPRSSSLLAAITPGPAAQRREASPPEADVHIPSRRKNDAPTAIPKLVPSRAPIDPDATAVGLPDDDKTSMTAPAPARPKPPTLPPPGPHAPPAAVTPPPPIPTAPQYPRASFDDDFNTAAAASAYPVRARTPSELGPPPTRIQRPEAHVDRPFTPPQVNPVPEIPEPTLVNAARYAVRFWRARWQRRGAIKTLGTEIKQDTEALDQVLGALGKVARTAKVEGRVFSAENAAISAAEERVRALSVEHGDVDARKIDENSKFVDVERERNTKLTEAERTVDEAQKELAHLEGQRRGQRDRRKDIERRQKAYLKNAEDNDRQSGAQQMGDARAELRRSAEEHRRNAAALEPERQDAERRITALERPISEATARLDAAKAELDAAKRSLADAREGHTHRLAELDAEQKRKSREMTQAEGEIARRLVTLGTLVNLNRIEDPQFDELYHRIDRLRGAITARTTEIEKLTAERDAYDRGTLVRGVATIGGAIVALIAFFVILRAIL